MIKKSGMTGIKGIIIWALIGLAAVALMSLGTTAIAMKTADPLQVAEVCALASAGAGFAVASFGAVRSKKSLVAGFVCGGAELLLLFLLSLAGENGAVAPLWLFSCAVLGTVAGAFLGKGRKINTAKRVKAITKRK